MNDHYQLLIIGGGPAGLAAAVTASGRGISCALLDEQPGPGGQIYRAIESVPQHRARQLGPDYLHGKTLAETFRQSDAAYFPGTQVWSLNRHLEVGVLHQDKARTLQVEQVIIANGAYERPVPFPGWTLPGVMQAGAGQILLKSAGIVPDQGVVLAGSGPLLLLLAWQYLQAGVEIKALLDLTPFDNFLSALTKLPKALFAFEYLRKGISYHLALKRAGIPIYLAVSELQAEGDDCLQQVQFRSNGKSHRINTDLLLTHFGVIPQISLSQAAGCDHRWDDRQQCWRPYHDDWGNTDLKGILIAGDAAAINGARYAENSGRLAALEALHHLAVISQSERNQLARQYHKQMKKERLIRPFLEKLYRIPKSLRITPDRATIVCRCEEISAGEIQKAVDNGHHDSNQVKFISRCGMGPCQGRQCINAVTHIVAASIGKTEQEAGCFRGRPPVTPLTLGQLAALQTGEQR